MKPKANRILLVDDEKDFLATLAKRLSLRKFSVSTACSGEEALSVLQKKQTDIVVLDVKMPGMDGIATLKEIKKQFPLLEVIMLTGHADLEASLEGMKLGFFDYLTKPVDIKQLVRKIEHALLDESQRKQKKRSSFSNKMQEHMILADRLASLGTLAASVAHEINNPLAIIRESAGWLKDKTAKEKDLSPNLIKAFELALNKIDSSVDRASRISSGLLSFARKTDSVALKVNLFDLICEVLELTKKAASNKQVKTKASLESQNPIVTCDPYQLRQVLLDLCTNAIQAVHPKGLVEIKIKDHAFGLAVEVKDNGPGIEKNNLERIFEPFFTTKPPDQGTGLGLAVSRSIMEKLGGTIEVESEKGQGSVFRVLVPLQPISDND